MLPALWRRWQPYILLTLLALPALWPLGGAGLPRTNDALTHVYRAVELDALVRAGVFFPRLAPDLVHGYGYPVFNFFPYLAHYLVVALHLAGLNFVAAYNAACGLALLSSAWWAYCLGREHFGEAAGLITGAAYLYSPYLLYDTYTRGSLPENLALALLPLSLLYLRRAAHGERRALPYAALALAAALFAHHGVMLQVMPLVVGYAVWEVKRDERPKTKDESKDDRRRTTDDRRLARTGTKSLESVLHSHSQTRTLTHFFTRTLSHLHTFTLALLLSAFFWLPALVEARYAQVERGTGNGGMSYADNFLSVGELLALPRLPVDPALLNPPVVRPLPLAALGLAALALARFAYQRYGRGVRRPSPDHSRAVVFFTLAALAGTLLIHPLARPLWDNLPLLRLTLFPWRLLGPVSLFIALLAGALFAAVPALRREVAPSSLTSEANRAQPRPPTALFPFILHPSSFILLVLFGLPFASPPRETVPPAPTLADVAAFEIPPNFIGTTTVGEYLPVWVHRLPDTAPNRDQLMAGQPVQRHEAPGADVGVKATRPTDDTYAVQADAPLTFVYRAFYFPGWQATLDGRPAPITITEPAGLMAVAIPAGAHTLRFYFGPTPVRLVGGALTTLGLLITGALLLTTRSPRTQPVAPRTGPEAQVSHSSLSSVVRLPPANAGGRPSSLPSSFIRLPPASHGGLPSSLVLFLLAAALIPFRLFYDAGRTPLLQPGPRLAAPLNLDFATELTLLGAEASATALAADDTLRVDLYWMANHPLGIPYGFDVRLVDAAGHTWSQDEVTRPRDWRFTPGTDFWPVDQYILDPYLLQPQPGTPPGDYTVRVNVFAWPTLQSIGTQDLLPVNISAPSRARACPADAGVEAAWDGVLLASVGLSTPAAAPGDDVIVSPCWLVVGNSAEAAPHAPLTAELRLYDSQGRVAHSQAFTPGAPYPADQWQPGIWLRDQVEVRLPAALETGTYTWALAVNGTQAVNAGTVAVTAPERAFNVPDVAERLEADLGPLTLHGLTVARTSLTPGTDLPVTLVWQADELVPKSYHVFVHLLAPDGHLAAQSDGVPAGWTRRTTGWLPGEFVTDARTLALRPDLAPGNYTLWAGVYLPATGERLTSSEFADGRVPLGEVVVD